MENIPLALPTTSPLARDGLLVFLFLPGLAPWLGLKLRPVDECVEANIETICSM